MSLKYFEGPAGSGKTYSLMEEVKAVLREQPLADHQKLLALTKIHGSRKRLLRRLLGIQELERRFDCLTADSYARHLLGRWRSRATLRFGDMPGNEDHDEFSRRAAILLEDDDVIRWVTATHPVIVVDELQDSEGGQLRMLQALAKSAVCLAAADDFQDLSGSEKNDAVAWARDFGNVVALTGNKRASTDGLKKAALDIRAGRQVINADGFEIVRAESYGLGAWHVSKHISAWRNDGRIAVITPSGPKGKSFVKMVVDRVEEKEIGKKWTYGPHTVPWEQSSDTERDEFFKRIKLPSTLDAEIVPSQLKLSAKDGLSAALFRWCDRQRRVAARDRFTVAEIRAQVALIQQHARAYSVSWNRRVCAMTVHQAKNRQFESAIVLWPLRIIKDEQKQRRMLYNAVTRAKHQAIVIVQDPNKNRLSEPPFAPIDTQA